MFGGFKIMQIKLQGFLLSALVAMTIIGAWGTALAQDEEDYTPAFEVGSGVADWWTAYPDQHENASRPVQHPGWVLDDLKEKPVLILVHASYCKPCLVHNP